MIITNCMDKVYVPYSGNSPVPVIINGHRMLIVAPVEDVLEDSLDLVGADRIEELELGESEEEKTATFHELAREYGAQVVVAPGEVELSSLLKSLEYQLPWVQ